MAGAALRMERLTKEAKFQRPHSEAGPDLARLMLAPSRLMEAITKRPPSSDQKRGATSRLPGQRTYATGSLPMEGSSWMVTLSTVKPGPLKRLKCTPPSSTRRPRERSSEPRSRSP